MRRVQKDLVIDLIREFGLPIAFVVHEPHDLDDAPVNATVAVAASGNLDDAVERPEVADDEVQVNIDAGLNALCTYDQTGRAITTVSLDALDCLQSVGRRDVGREEFDAETEFL